MPKTNGISPKAVAATVTAVLTYLLGQELLELPVWATVVGQLVLVGLAAYAAPAGDVIASPVGPPSDDLLMTHDVRKHMEAGYGAVEVLLIAFLPVLLLIVVLRFL